MMAVPATRAPRFSAEGAARLADQFFCLRAVATPLPSERDQNFLLRTDAREWLVLKIANSGEQRDVLEYQNEVLAMLAERCPELRFPHIVGGIARSGRHFVR